MATEGGEAKDVDMADVSAEEVSNKENALLRPRQRNIHLYDVFIFGWLLPVRRCGGQTRSF